jgi:UDP-glucose 4-epimerase
MRTSCWVLGAGGLVGNTLKEMAQLQSNVDFVFLDRGQFDLGTSSDYPAFKPTDIVIDLIPSPYPRKNSQVSREDYHKNFTEPHLRFIRHLATCALGKIIFLSSGGTVYGRGDLHRSFTEQSELRPVSLYGESKLLVENEIVKCLPHTIFRIGNIFNINPHADKLTSVVGVYLDRFKKHLPVDIFGDDSIAKDYVSNRDVVRAIFLAIGERTNGIYNIGSGKAVSLKAIIDALEKSFGRNAERIMHPSYADDVSVFRLDVTKARQELGFVPQDDLLEWIRDLRLDQK